MSNVIFVYYQLIHLEEVMECVLRMHEVPFHKGVGRVYTTIKIDDRHDKPATIEGKVRSVENKKTIPNLDNSRVEGACYARRRVFRYTSGMRNVRQTRQNRCTRLAFGDHSKSIQYGVAKKPSEIWKLSN